MNPWIFGLTQSGVGKSGSDLVKESVNLKLRLEKRSDNYMLSH